MTAAPILLPNYTIEDWEQWDGRWELIQGVPYAMSPMANITHQDVCGNAYYAFRQALAACAQCRVYQPLNYKISEHTMFEPDMLVVCGERPRGTYLTQTPTLILEVLSKGTVSKDRFVKYVVYQQQGVRYYLMADPKTRTIEVYELKEGDYEKVFERQHGGDYTFTLDDECAIRIDFSSFWAI